MFPAILSIIAPILGKVIDKIPNQEEREKARLQLQKELAEQEAKILELVMVSADKQTEVNAEEAKSTNLFVSGWRPSIGWIGAAALAWFYILAPMTSWILAVCGSTTKLPTLDMNGLMELVIGMLGLGGLRTYEKVRGVANK